MPVETSRLRRGLTIAGLPARAAGRGVAVQVRGLLGADRAVLREQARAATAADTRTTLGGLKGGALKLGQLLSTVDALFPADPEDSWQSALGALQERNPGLPFAEVQPVLAAELGPHWTSRFRSFDEAPAAAASIGQVHRATWSDGTPVAVKVQYPGVAEAIASDVRSLALALRATSLVARGMAMPPLIAELRTRLGEELDYRTEGAHQQAFAQAYADDPRTWVPPVLHASHRVLVSRWMDGTGLAEVARDGSADERDGLGAAYQHFFLTSPARVGLLHTDPHPGNFRLLDDGRMGVLDFGSVLVMPGGLPPTFGGLIRAMTRTDPGDVERALRAGGFIAPGATLEVDKLIDYLAPFSEPARHEVFSFSREWLRSQFGRVNDPRNPDFLVAMQLTIPAEQLFTHRLWLGLVGVLCGLGATVPVRPELEAHLPGFADPIDAGPAAAGPGPVTRSGRDPA
jgi:predicted unusual protein kinase regulating ubiquinone biosynthesis (AarF/ABC1/UbiB family)